MGWASFLRLDELEVAFDVVAVARGYLFFLHHLFDDLFDNGPCVCCAVFGRRVENELPDCEATGTEDGAAEEAEETEESLF